MRLLRWTLAAMLPFLLVGAAQADQLDQSFVAPTTEAYEINSNETLAQTFTVGLTGTLDRIGVQVSQVGGTGDLTIDVIGTIGGTPDPTNILASLTAPSSDFPTTLGGAASPTQFDLGSQSFTVTAGEVLAIELSSTSSLGFNWVIGGTGGSYSGGDLYLNFLSPNQFVDANTDAGFQTFVQTSAVPEPSGLVMLGSGIAGVLAYTVRRRVGARWPR